MLFAAAARAARSAAPSSAARASCLPSRGALLAPSAARLAGPRPGEPFMSFAYVPPNYNPATSLDFEVMPRDSYGVPAHIPPDIGAAIQHTYHVPPSYYPFIKKLGDDSPELKPYTDKLIKGQLTFHDFECMFYHNCQPLKIFRKRIPLPHRTPEEIGKSDEVTWESKWYTLRQLYYCEFLSRYVFRDWMLALFLGLFSAQLWITELWIYRQDMKLFYLEAPEHKINWNVPRGDL